MVKRKLIINECHETTVIKSWDKAAIIVREYDGGSVAREVVIRIPHPAYLRDIREHLDEIEKAWREMI